MIKIKRWIQIRSTQSGYRTSSQYLHICCLSNSYSVERGRVARGEITEQEAQLKRKTDWDGDIYHPDATVEYLKGFAVCICGERQSLSSLRKGRLIIKNYPSHFFDLKVKGDIK